MILSKLITTGLPPTLAKLNLHLRLLLWAKIILPASEPLNQIKGIPFQVWCLWPADERDEKMEYKSSKWTLSLSLPLLLSCISVLQRGLA